jgi:opacity protein-like surface antigen
MTGASQSAKAVFDSSGGAIFGGSVRLGFGPRWFAAVGSNYFSKDGERAFVADPTSPPFRLGHTLNARVIPVYALGGYRFRAGKTLVPYAAAGIGFTSFRESSTVAELEDVHSESKVSYHVAGGAEYGQGTVRFGAEILYTSAPDTLGLGGVSKVYDEKDVGGLSFMAKIVFVP